LDVAWTAPITFTAGSTLTAAQLNTYLRDNMLLMAPNIGTTIGDYFASDAANSIVRRLPVSSRQPASVNTTSVTYVQLGAGTPTVTATTGTRAMIFLAVRIENNTANAGALCSYQISGATTAAAADSISVAIDGIAAANFNRLAMANCETVLTAGSNTFTVNYRATSGTATFQDRLLAVLPF
jgi:hypothetical protein